MNHNWTPEKIKQMGEDVRKKILSRSEWLARCDGQITIKVIPNGEGFDVKITART